ncbi:MAG TPA: hypothetical protein VFW87_10565 [Pirellulales bacterium]|nr:hypothetical protein [Pirellulales bacterium]
MSQPIAICTLIATSVEFSGALNNPKPKLGEVAFHPITVFHKP